MSHDDAISETSLRGSVETVGSSSPPLSYAEQECESVCRPASRSGGPCLAWLRSTLEEGCLVEFVDPCTDNTVKFCSGGNLVLKIEDDEELVIEEVELVHDDMQRPVLIVSIEGGAEREVVLPELALSRSTIVAELIDALGQHHVQHNLDGLELSGRDVPSMPKGDTQASCNCTVM